MNYAGTFKGIGEDKEAINEMGEIIIDQVVNYNHPLCEMARKKITTITQAKDYGSLSMFDKKEESEEEPVVEETQVEEQTATEETQVEEQTTTEEKPVVEKPQTTKKPTTKKTTAKKPTKKTTKK